MEKLVSTPPKAQGVIEGSGNMGREFIGECPGPGEDPELDDFETELTIKYIKQACGEPPRGVDVRVTSEGCEVGNEGLEVSYPVISVVWDDYEAEYPDEYIGKCIEAFERFDLPEEIHERYRALFALQHEIEKLCEKVADAARANLRNADQQTESEQDAKD